MTSQLTHGSRKKGFTLVELIIVIAVIGVLAAILIPVFANVIKKANAESALTDARNAVSMYVTEALERRVLGDIFVPENIAIIVEKGGRYYLFGYNAAVTGSILVSNANVDGIEAADLDALISSSSFNALNGGTYDPNTTYTVSDGYFYLVPYAGLTPGNPNVRSFASAPATGEIYHRLDDFGVDGLDLNIGNDACIYHGCLVNGTYGTTSSTSSPTSTPTATPSASPTPTPTPVQHTVTFAISGVDSADEDNVVIKHNGTAVTGSSVTVTGNSNLVADFTAEYPHNESTDEYWYVFNNTTPASGTITSDITLTFNFSRQNNTPANLDFVMGSGETFVAGNGASAHMELVRNQNVTAYIVGSSASKEGKTFSHWQKQGDSSVTYSASSAGPITLPAGGLTLVPVFDDVQYTVTYKAGTEASGSDYQTTVTYGEHTLPTYSTIKTAAGWTLDTATYAFLHWTDGHNTYNDGATYNFTGNVTLTAVYTTLQFTVEYAAGTGVTTSTASATYNVGTSSVDITGVAVNSNYYLTKYTVVNSRTGSTDISASATSIDTSAAQAGDTITITPVATSKYVTVSFVSSPTGASNMPANQTVQLASGNTVSLTTPSLSGYNFTNYTVTSQSGITASISGSTLTLSSPTANNATVTVTANFVGEHANDFSVEYIQVTGIDSVPAKQYYPVGTTSVPINHDGVVINDLYTRSDWAMGNYSTTSLAEWTANLDTSSITAGTNITLTTYVSKKQCTVTFVSSPAGATGLPGTTSYYYVDGLTYTISNTPTLSGYDFTGYTLTSSTGSGVSITLSGEQNRTITFAKVGSSWTSGTATVTANFTASAPVTHTITFTDGDSTNTATATHNVSTSLATLNPLSTPSGKELDKFVIGGTDYAKDASYTFTSNTTVTVVWKNTAANSFTLNLKYWNRKGTSVQQTKTWVIDLAVGSTINFDITDLKQAGVYRSYSSGGLGVYSNYISITKSATIDTSDGSISSGSAVYSFSYTRVAGDGNSHDIDIYAVGCDYPPATDPAIYSGTHHGNAIPDLPCVDTYVSASIIDPVFNMRSIPGINNPTVIIPVPYEDR